MLSEQTTLCLVFLYVFFFKQKTAYEMRISDWSSDVCSSDLQVGERRWYNDRLAMFHMRHRLPERYGALNPPGRGTKHPATRAREAEEAAWVDAGDETADIIANRLREIERKTYETLLDNPTKRPAWALERKSVG